jgi:hypothetical protein
MLIEVLNTLIKNVKNGIDAYEIVIISMWLKSNSSDNRFANNFIQF